MIDEALIKYQHVVNHEVVDLQASFAKSLRSKENELNARGLLSSSAAVIAYQDIGQSALRAGGQVILSQLLRCLAAYGVEWNGDVLIRVKAALSEQIALHATVLRSRILALGTFRTPSFAGMKDGVEMEFNKQTERVIDRMSHELEIAASASKPRPSGAQTFNFHGAVGVVQTGDASMASVHQHIGAEVSDQIVRVLTELLDRLEKGAPGLAVNQDALKDLVRETIDEAKKPAPNPLKLGSSLRTIGETVKFVGSLEVAYNGLKPILGAMGIHLP